MSLFEGSAAKEGAGFKERDEPVKDEGTFWHQRVMEKSQGRVIGRPASMDGAGGGFQKVGLHVAPVPNSLGSGLQGSLGSSS